MEPITIVAGLTAAAASGLAFGAGARLIPVAWQASSDVRRWSNSSDGTVETERQRQRKVIRLKARKRDSSIIGLYGDLLRHTDGSYTRGYDFPLQATMLASDEVADSIVDGLADMLTVELPAGTVLQYRYTVGPDPGRAIAEHLRARDYEQAYFPAARLHDLNIDFFKTMADARAFRQERASLFVRVPARHEADHSAHGFNTFISSMAADWRASGFNGVRRKAGPNWSNSRNDGIVRRIREHEEETIRATEKIFRLLEMQSPVSLRRLDRQQLWRAVHQSHVMASPSVPRLPQYDGLDLRNYLCAETIEDHGWYVMHGIYPATLVSLFAPGEDFIAADAMRALTAHPGLSFPHTIITEFISMDREKAKARLDSHIKHVERSGTRADGRYQLTPEAEASFNDLKETRKAITGSREALVKMRQYAVMYGDPARTRHDLRRSLKQLDVNADTLVSAFQTLDGVQAGREEPAALHCLYPGSLVGEACSDTNGRELTEVAHSLAAFIPAESSWSGSHRPHTLLTTASGRLVGLNLWDKSSRTNIKSPVVLILGEPGTGKTICGVRIINDALATIPHLRVHALDNGGSLAPHAHVTGARYHRFNPEEPKAINIWDFPELVYGKDLQLNKITEQISLIVMDAMSLAEADDPLARDLLSKAVVQVLKNIAPRNGPDRPRREPTHSDLVAMLEAYDFGSEALNHRAKEIALALEKYLDNPWLDAPTHPHFHLDSPYDVYELDSLNAFQPDIKQTLANRIGARVIRAIGQKQADGTHSPTLLVFDEVHEYRESFPGLIPVLKKGTRHGRKHNVVTMMMTHTYNDFEGMHDVTSTAGVKLIGKQTGDLSLLAHDAKLSSRTIQAIGAIKNVDGLYSQWVMVLGSGDYQQVETVQNNLSPSLLWTFTTHPDEANARARAAALRPDWPLAEVIAWLAMQYPQGWSLPAYCLMSLCWRMNRVSYKSEVAMIGNHLSRYLVVGLLFGLLIIPASPAQAQFTVWDPTNYALQLEKKIEEANRWLETIRHYATMVDKAVQQLITMQGVLRNVDEQLARNVRLVRFISSVGHIVRGSYQLKRQLEGMIRYRIAMLKSIDDRLRNGLFDPEQDLIDLENYLKFTIGRSADETVARLDKLARNDSQLESWCVRRTQIQKDLAVARATLNQAEEQLEAEKNKPDVDQSSVAHLNDVILQQQKLIAELEKEHADLQDKITERAAKYGLRLQDMENFAFSIMTVNDGWLSLQETKDQIERTLTDLIINAHPSQQP